MGPDIAPQDVSLPVVEVQARPARTRLLERRDLLRGDLSRARAGGVALDFDVLEVVHAKFEQGGVDVKIEVSVEGGDAGGSTVTCTRRPWRSIEYETGPKLVGAALTEIVFPDRSHATGVA